MTSLADVRRGDQFLLAARCTDRDVTAGLTFSMFSAMKAPIGQLIIAPAGTFTGVLASAPDLIPVSLITGFAPLQTGDILERAGSGETAVVRWTSIKPDGTVQWSSSAAARIIYPADGWFIIGHVSDL